MAEYIEREATKKEFNIHFGDVHDAVIANRLIDSIQAADVAPVRHGKWISFGGNHYTRISQCTNCCAKYDFRSNYCPNCGAKMDGERRNDGE